MKTKIEVNMTLDPEVVRKGRVCAGLIPFSRFVEHLLKKEIEKWSKARDGGEP